MKEHLTDRYLDAARRELNGEVVATKSTGRPRDQLDEVRNAQNGLVNRIGQLKRLLGDSRVSASDKAQFRGGALRGEPVVRPFRAIRPSILRSTF
jgi:hypothetical protein